MQCEAMQVLGGSIGVHRTLAAELTTTCALTYIVQSSLLSMTFASHSSCMSFPQNRSKPMEPCLPEAKRKAKDERHVSCVCRIMVPVARLKFSYRHASTDGGTPYLIELAEDHGNMRVN